jgi:hypothetical protein
VVASVLLCNEACVTCLTRTTHGRREIAVGVAARVVNERCDLFTTYAASDCSRCRSSVTVGNFNLENLDRSKVDGSHDHTRSWLCVNGVERGTSISGSHRTNLRGLWFSIDLGDWDPSTFQVCLSTTGSPIPRMISRFDQEVE